MAALFEVRATSGRYQVLIGEGQFTARLRACSSRSVILADAVFADQLRPLGLRLVEVRADEGAKTLTSVAEIIAELRDQGLARDMSLIAIGGGVVQDIAGFIASIYMRGVPWIYFPTTLLAMADSCVGGKSSMNVGPYKNLAGTYHPPTSIEVDVSLCASQSADQRAAGLIEAAKICFCHGEADLEAYLSLGPSPASDTATLCAVVELSLMAKRRFVEADEFDRGDRLLLNFGHTFGHALETASDFTIPHGLAVGLGILAAGALQRERGVQLSSDSPSTRLERHVTALLRCAPRLGNGLAQLRWSELMPAFQADKKHGQGHWAVIAPTAEGGVERLELPRSEATRRQIAAAFEQALAPFNAAPPAAPNGAAPSHTNPSQA